MVDLSGHLVAITSTCTTKLERFDEIGIQDKRNFKRKLLEMFYWLFEEIAIVNKIRASNF